MKSRRDGDLVYSSEEGKMCPQCGRALSFCSCKHDTNAVEGDGIIRISQERKGRKGKGVTLIRGLPLSASALTTLAKKLKRTCGTGGTVKAGVIEIQGEHCELLITILKKEGYSVRRSGG